MGKNLDTAVAEFATRNHGVFTLAVARDLGAMPEHVRSRLGSGRWNRLYDEVFAIAGTVASWKQELVAACFAGAPGAVASHRSAAALWELPGGRTDQSEITCPRWRRAHEKGPIVHECKALDPVDARVVDEIPTTSPELTLLQLGAVCAPSTVEAAYDVARRRQLVTEQSVRELIRRLGGRGRNGVGVLRVIVDDRARLSALPESPMESRLLRALRRFGLPDPVPQYEVRHGGSFVARVDFAYPDAKVAVEYDSDEYHFGETSRDRDNARRRRLERLGWRVVNVTRGDMRAGGLEAAQTVLDLLRTSS